MSENLCSRCQEKPAGLERPPFRGALGESIAASVCRACWDEWREMEVRVINELRLNFMDPEAQETLHRHLREFLKLES